MTQRQLPTEIPQLVFNNFNKKADTEGGLLVCKRWNDIIHEVYWKKFRIMLRGARLVPFLQYLEDDLLIVAKVGGRLCFDIRTNGIIDTNGYAPYVESIIQKVSNDIKVLSITTHAATTYLQLLNQPQINLPNLKRLYVSMYVNDDQVKKLYSSSLFKFRSTLTYV